MDITGNDEVRANATAKVCKSCLICNNRWLINWKYLKNVTVNIIEIIYSLLIITNIANSIGGVMVGVPFIDSDLLYRGGL